MSWNRQDAESPSSDSLGLPLPGPDWRASRFGPVIVAMRGSVPGRSARPANPATVEVGKTSAGLANMKHDLEERPRRPQFSGGRRFSRGVLSELDWGRNGGVAALGPGLAVVSPLTHGRGRTRRHSGQSKARPRESELGELRVLAVQSPRSARRASKQHASMPALAPPASRRFPGWCQRISDSGH